MFLFSDFVNVHALQKLPLAGSRYTWSSMQEVHHLSKLDRFFTSSELDSLFPISKGESLPQPTSDHRPILLNGKVEMIDPKPFRLKIMWLKYPGFVGLVYSWWNSF